MESPIRARSWWRTILTALAGAAALDVALTALVLAIEGTQPAECWRRWVPAMDRIQTAAMVLVLASVGLVALLLARRAGSLREVPSALDAGQALVLVAGTGLLVASCEGVCLAARAFEPTREASVDGPGGRTAHLYAGGFWSCNYVVYVAEPGAMTMAEVTMIERERCDGDYTVRWNDDGTLTIVDARGHAVADQPNSLFPQKKLCRRPRRGG